MTSAPQSASRAPATGTKTHCASSITRTPSKARARSSGSATGAPAARSKDDDRDQPVSPCLVHVVVGPDIGDDAPEPRSLRFGRSACDDRQAVRADLDLGQRVLLQVEVPLGMHG